MNTLYIARPIQFPTRFVEDASYYDPMRPMKVELSDPQPLLDYIIKIQEAFLNQNISVIGLQFGINDYFSLREEAHKRYSWAAKFDDGVLCFNDWKIYLDPMRDDGAPTFVFDEGEAIKIMAVRKKQ